MKTILFATALLLAGTAAAQTYGTQSTTTHDTHTATTTMANADIPNAGETVAPSNADPEHDARGIAVISDAAVVPAGFNLTPGMTGMGGPADTGATPQPASESYPACTAEITDNCVQTYERGRSR